MIGGVTRQGGRVAWSARPVNPPCRGQILPRKRFKVGEPA